MVVKGPKGELSQKVDPRIKIKEEENALHFSTTNGTKEESALPVSYTHLDVYKRQVWR